jgi:hypothetical protein
MGLNTCCLLESLPVLTVSQSKLPIGNLLSNLDQETQARVLEERFINQPIVLAMNSFAKKIQEALISCSYFDMELGRFVRTVKGKGSAKPGPMGTILTSGYVQVEICKYKFVQSHLIYLWFTGKFPDSREEMDHIDGNRLNDQPENLRCVSAALNARNHKKHKDNTTGYTGVYQNNVSISNPYMASVRVNGRNKHLGCFLTAKDAYMARQAWMIAHPEYGYTTRHGF